MYNDLLGYTLTNDYRLYNDLLGYALNRDYKIVLSYEYIV